MTTAGASYEELVEENGILRAKIRELSLIESNGNNTEKSVRKDGTGLIEAGQAEEESQRGQKLESLGLLAGGIAHDFNNLLTAIMGNVSFSLHLLNKNDRIYNRLEEAEKAALRARDLTKQLITFVRGGDTNMETIDLNEMIKESASFALRGSNVKYTVEIAPGTSSVDADPGQINQVLNNLIINAGQAMPEGGTISIKTENIEVKAGSEKSVPHLKEGQYVKISVTDKGAGIPERELQKVFDPYFTTKQSGSGLGLSCAYSIIKRYNGCISVNSKAGSGSTFTVYLPSSGKVPSSTEERLPDIYKGSGRVLVMDDEEVIRDLVKEYLTHLGYTVSLTTNGTEAIKVYTEAHTADRPFDLVIMDLTIPGGMGGKEAIVNLLKIDPYVKAIVSSGYADDPVMEEFKKHGFSGVVAKPYRLEELSGAIKKTLLN